jgi:small subunit ribosomal protein S6
MVAGYSPSPLLAATREYELVLMLDAGQDAPARDALAQQARAQIEGGGTLKHENNWGLRKLAYEISQRTEADYRWFRFEATPDLLEALDHSLKITDGVLRFRIFKVDPEAPVMVPPAAAAPGPESSRERTGPPRSAPQPAPAPVASEAPPAAEEQAPEQPEPAAEGEAAADAPAESSE